MMKCAKFSQLSAKERYSEIGTLCLDVVLHRLVNLYLLLLRDSASLNGYFVYLFF